MANSEYFGKDSRRGDTRGVIFGIPSRYTSIGSLKTAITKQETLALQECLVLNRAYPRRNRKFREKFLQTLSNTSLSVIGSQFHQDENAGMAYWSEAYCFETKQHAIQFASILEGIASNVRGMQIEVY